MASLAEYYQGLVGAGSLDWRDREQLVEQGTPLRYAPEDMPFMDDRTIRETRERGGTMLIPTAQGGYNTIRPDADVLPGGARLISAGEAAARYAGSQREGGRPLDDPFGVARGAYQQATNAAEQQAYKTADYLSQFLPPERVVAETRRMTGVDLSGKLASTPNLLKREGDVAGIAKTQAETLSTEAQRREREQDIIKKRQDLLNEKADTFGALETAVTNLNRLSDAAAAVRDSKDLAWAAGPIASRLPTVTQGSANVEAGLFSLKAQVGFAALTALREASKTGGGLGNISDADIKNLQNSIAALELSQSPESIRKALDTVVKYADDVRAKMERGYQSKYGKLPVELPRPGHEQLPVAARQLLQEGKAAHFGNGQVWTLERGVPKRLK
jgi:hypothetical protein